MFVYGTLKRGHQRNHVLADQTFVGKATTAADYRMVDLGSYPGLTEVDPGTGVQVRGEIYQVDRACLQQLDQIEAVDAGLYERREIRLNPLEEPKLPRDRGLPVNHSTEAYFYLGDVHGRNDSNDCW